MQFEGVANRTPHKKKNSSFRDDDDPMMMDDGDLLQLVPSGRRVDPRLRTLSTLPTGGSPKITGGRSHVQLKMGRKLRVVGPISFHPFFKEHL